MGGLFNITASHYSRFVPYSTYGSKGRRGKGKHGEGDGESSIDAKAWAVALMALGLGLGALAAAIGGHDGGDDDGSDLDDKPPRWSWWDRMVHRGAIREDEQRRIERAQSLILQANMSARKSSDGSKPPDERRQLAHDSFQRYSAALAIVKPVKNLDPSKQVGDANKGIERLTARGYTPPARPATEPPIPSGAGGGIPDDHEERSTAELGPAPGAGAPAGSGPQASAPGSDQRQTSDERSQAARGGRQVATDFDDDERTTGEWGRGGPGAGPPTAMGGSDPRERSTSDRMTGQLGASRGARDTDQDAVPPGALDGAGPAQTGGPEPAAAQPLPGTPLAAVQRQATMQRALAPIHEDVPEGAFDIRDANWFGRLMWRLGGLPEQARAWAEAYRIVRERTAQHVQTITALEQTIAGLHQEIDALTAQLAQFRSQFETNRQGVSDFLTGDESRENATAIKKVLQKIEEARGRLNKALVDKARFLGDLQEELRQVRLQAIRSRRNELKGVADRAERAIGRAVKRAKDDLRRQKRDVWTTGVAAAGLVAQFRDDALRRLSTELDSHALPQMRRERDALIGEMNVRFGGEVFPVVSDMVIRMDEQIDILEALSTNVPRLINDIALGQTAQLETQSGHIIENLNALSANLEAELVSARAVQEEVLERRREDEWRQFEGDVRNLMEELGTASRDAAGVVFETVRMMLDLSVRLNKTMQDGERELARIRGEQGRLFAITLADDKRQHRNLMESMTLWGQGLLQQTFENAWRRIYEAHQQAGELATQHQRQELHDALAAAEWSARQVYRDLQEGRRTATQLRGEIDRDERRVQQLRDLVRALKEERRQLALEVGDLFQDIQEAYAEGRQSGVLGRRSARTIQLDRRETHAAAVRRIREFSQRFGSLRGVRVRIDPELLLGDGAGQSAAQQAVPQQTPPYQAQVPIPGLTDPGMPAHSDPRQAAPAPGAPPPLPGQQPAPGTPPPVGPAAHQPAQPQPSVAHAHSGPQGPRVASSAITSERSTGESGPRFSVRRAWDIVSRRSNFSTGGNVFASVLHEILTEAFTLDVQDARGVRFKKLSPDQKRMIYLELASRLGMDPLAAQYGDLAELLKSWIGSSTRSTSLPWFHWVMDMSVSFGSFIALQLGDRVWRGDRDPEEFADPERAELVASTTLLHAWVLGSDYLKKENPNYDNGLSLIDYKEQQDFILAKVYETVNIQNAYFAYGMVQKYLRLADSLGTWAGLSRAGPAIPDVQKALVYYAYHLTNRLRAVDWKDVGGIPENQQEMDMNLGNLRGQAMGKLQELKANEETLTWLDLLKPGEPIIAPQQPQADVQADAQAVERQRMGRPSTLFVQTSDDMPVPSIPQRPQPAQRSPEIVDLPGADVARRSVKDVFQGLWGGMDDNLADVLASFNENSFNDLDAMASWMNRVNGGHEDIDASVFTEIRNGTLPDRYIAYLIASAMKHLYGAASSITGDDPLRVQMETMAIYAFDSLKQDGTVLDDIDGAALQRAAFGDQWDTLNANEQRAWVYTVESLFQLKGLDSTLPPDGGAAPPGNTPPHAPGGPATPWNIGGGGFTGQHGMGALGLLSYGLMDDMPAGSVYGDGWRTNANVIDLVGGCGVGVESPTMDVGSPTAMATFQPLMQMNMQMNYLNSARVFMS